MAPTKPMLIALARMVQALQEALGVHLVPAISALQRLPRQLVKAMAASPPTVKLYPTLDQTKMPRRLMQLWTHLADHPKTKIHRTTLRQTPVKERLRVTQLMRAEPPHPARALPQPKTRLARTAHNQRRRKLLVRQPGEPRLALSLDTARLWSRLMELPLWTMFLRTEAVRSAWTVVRRMAGLVHQRPRKIPTRTRSARASDMLLLRVADRRAVDRARRLHLS